MCDQLTEAAEKVDAGRTSTVVDFTVYTLYFLALFPCSDIWFPMSVCRAVARITY